nr:hypothetical protein [Larkinella rosea]
MWFNVGLVFIERCILFQYFENQRVGVEGQNQTGFSDGERHRSIAHVRADVDDKVTFFRKFPLKVAIRKLNDIRRFQQRIEPLRYLNLALFA